MKRKVHSAGCQVFKQDESLRYELPIPQFPRARTERGVLFAIDILGTRNVRFGRLARRFLRFHLPSLSYELEYVVTELRAPSGQFFAHPASVIMRPQP